MPTPGLGSKAFSLSWGQTSLSSGLRQGSIALWVQSGHTPPTRQASGGNKSPHLPQSPQQGKPLLPLHGPQCWNVKPSSRVLSSG